MNAKKSKRPLIHRDESLPGKPEAAESLERKGTPVVAAEGAPLKPESSGREASPLMKREGSPKEEFTRSSARESQPMQGLADMVPPKDAGASRSASEEPGQGYVRMRVRVRDGELRVLDARLVDGPLTQASSFPGHNLYEVTLDGRLLHAGALPDLGIQRSFPDPDAKEGPRVGHHFADRTAFEFTARVPAGDVTTENVARVELTLHRIKGEARAERLGTEPLTEQFSREVRPVARLRGLPESVVPEALVREGKRAVRPE